MYALPAGIVILLVAGTPNEAWQLVAVICVLAPVIGLMWSPGASMITDGADDRFVPTVWGFALLQVGWAIGQSGGAAGGAALATATAHAVPFLALAALYAVTLIVLARRRALEG